MFSVNYFIPKTVRSRVVYNFSCAGCNVCLVGETKWHLTVRFREHLPTDENSYIFHHLESSKTCLAARSEACVSILDTTSSPFQLKIKGALHIGWE